MSRTPPTLAKECFSMWLAVAGALLCFAVATILFTPPLRGYPFYQSLSFYFLFEGGWLLLDAVVNLIWPYTTFMRWVHGIGTLIFVGYLLYKMFSYYWKTKHTEKQGSAPKALETSEEEEKKEGEQK